MRRKILFTHIPKTAGTSFSEEIIKSNYQNSDIFRYRGKRLLFHIYFKRPSFITGHFAFGLGNYLFNQYEYLTFLRDPVERAISHYYFILQSVHPGYEHPQYQLCNKTDLNNVYNSGKLLDNLQTRFISGTGYKSQPCSPKMLSLAKKNLEKHYPVFGIQENYDASLKLICSYYNLTNPSLVNRTYQKKTIEKPLVNEETREILRSQHIYDIELYEFAKERFHQMTC